MKANQKGFSVVEVLIVIAIVGLIGIVGWLVYDRQNGKEKDSNTVSTSSQKRFGYKNFEDQEHNLSFEYPEEYKLESSKIWGDKPQGGLEIWIYKSDLVDVDRLDEPEVLESEKMIAKISVINTNIDKVASYIELAKPDNKKTFKICGEPASSYNFQLLGKEHYTTEFQKKNLFFGVDTYLPSDERKVIHNSIVESIACD